MAKILSFPSNKIFRSLEEQGPERKIYDAGDDIPAEEVQPDKHILVRHKKTGVVHLEDTLNDDYLYCGHLMWFNFTNFEKYFGDENEVTCKKCMFNKPFMPHFGF